MIKLSVWNSHVLSILIFIGLLKSNSSNTVAQAGRTVLTESGVRLAGSTVSTTSSKEVTSVPLRSGVNNITGRTSPNVQVKTNPHVAHPSSVNKHTTSNSFRPDYGVLESIETVKSRNISNASDINQPYIDNLTPAFNYSKLYYGMGSATESSHRSITVTTSAKYSFTPTVNSNYSYTRLNNFNPTIKKNESTWVINK